MRNHDQRNYRISIALQIIGIAVLVVCCAYLVAGLIMYNMSLFSAPMWTARITGGQAGIAIGIAAAAVILVIAAHRNAKQLSKDRDADGDRSQAAG